ncbi:SDR family NAD(P)-dependent oxidoreductase [Bacillus sp. Marseille-P3661]|uniref:SDR family NAD(P)-dependent oxidoreductase n=1 Tax=Bacillus sp. Marseille-P3661 TaxID=1936234 RepID=UPI000C861779|nr:SDR family oxidoreductase [Bacillus sp. Marseille-P3661]
MEEKQVAIVTGGSSGIGRAVVNKFLKQGKIVAVVDLNEMAVTEENLYYYHADVSNQESAKQVATRIKEDLNRVDILVNCAGLARRAPSVDFTDSDLSLVLDVNLKGTVFMCQAAAPHMMNSGGGSIVNIGSMLAHYGTLNNLAYAGSKGGVIQVTKCLAVEWAEQNIRVNAVSPGYIETPLTNNFFKDERFFNHLMARTPQKRLGKLEEVANVIAFLASEEASFVTGVDIPIDGGILAGDPAISASLA